MAEDGIRIRMSTQQLKFIVAWAKYHIMDHDISGATYELINDMIYRSETALAKQAGLYPAKAAADLVDMEEDRHVIVVKTEEEKWAFIDAKRPRPGESLDDVEARLIADGFLSKK